MVKLSSRYRKGKVKYLGILEADNCLEEKMKLNVLKEYIRWLRNVLKSKVNGGNLVRGVSAWAVSLLRYLWSYSLVVKALDSQSRGPVFKTTGWLQGRLSLSSFRGR